MSAWRSLSAACAPSTAACPSLRQRHKQHRILHRALQSRAKRGRRCAAHRHAVLQQGSRRAVLCSISPPLRTRSTFRSSSTTFPALARRLQWRRPIKRCQASEHCRCQGGERQLRPHSGHPQPMPAGLHRLERQRRLHRRRHHGSWRQGASSPSPRMLSHAKCTS